MIQSSTLINNRVQKASQTKQWSMEVLSHEVLLEALFATLKVGGIEWNQLRTGERKILKEKRWNNGKIISYLSPVSEQRSYNSI